jgi:hypothetical protein
MTKELKGRLNRTENEDEGELERLTPEEIVFLKSSIEYAKQPGAKSYSMEEAQETVLFIPHHSKILFHPVYP